MSSPKTIIIGLGNPILGDDGVGWQVAEHIQQQTDLTSPIEVDCMAVGGISLMERLIGYERAILIDAIVTHEHPLGTVLCLSLEELPNRALGHLGSVHDTTLQNALQVGRLMGAQLPEHITIVAVESQNVYDFSDQLSETVAAAVPKAVQTVMDLL
jgi:hydrogenase maturation protease